MRQDEDEVRRALEARRSEGSPEFRAGLSGAWQGGRPAVNAMPAIAAAMAIIIALGSVGILMMARSARSVSHQGPASVSRLNSPPAVPESRDAGLFAPSTKVVWALVGGSLLFRSTDQGNTWEQRSLPAWVPSGRFEVSFVDDRQGWLYRAGVRLPQCTDSGAEIWRTTDGAATWKPVMVGTWTNNNAKEPECKEGLSFTDPQHGFIASVVTSRLTIYRTLDGGKNWTGADLPDAPSAPGISQRAGLVKKIGNSMYVVASSTQGPGTQVYRSTDGGATWSWLTTVPSIWVVTVTESRWLLLDMPGFSIETTNAGQQWHPYGSGFKFGSSPVFGDSRVGYADANGALLRTFDGGLHWERISTPGLPKLDLLPITDPGFTCRLPVGTGSPSSRSNGGFVAVPRGSFELDPAASMLTGEQQSVETSVKPVLKGSSGIAFDVPFSRWVPASPEVISSDGSQYAWTERESHGLLHVTKVADGSDRTFAAAPPPDLQGHGPAIPVPIGITTESVFLTYGWEGKSGVWRLDLASGSLIKLTGLPSPSYGAGTIWLELTRGPNQVGMYSDGDTLSRLDLRSGAVQDWFHRDNVVVRYLGFELEGNPWVLTGTFRAIDPRVFEIWRVRGPGQADLVLSGQQVSRVITDKHGTWFANGSGVYLYSSGRLQRVSSASVGEVVGPCL